MSETTKPTGLTLSRNRNNINIKWKVGDKDYGKGVQVKWCFAQVGQKKKNRTWHERTLRGTTTSTSITIPTGSLYPSTDNNENLINKKLDKVIVKVRGKRKPYAKTVNKKTHTVKPTWSDWTKKEFDILPPPAPTVSAALHGSQENVTTFSWSINPSDTAQAQFTDMVWESILLEKCEQTDGSKYSGFFKNGATGWQTGTSSTSSSKEISENTSTISRSTHTRWFRIKSRGPHGDSAWVYARHVYAAPNMAVWAKGYPVASRTNSNGYLVRAGWTASAPASHPIDSVNVEWLIAEPVEGMACPEGASWSNGATVRDTEWKKGTATDAVAFEVDNALGTDKCLFVRVNTLHDRTTTHGEPKVAAVGYLADPSDVSVETYDSTHRATISARNNSAVADSFLAITYIDSTDPDKSFVVGIISHGQGSVQVQCPDWTGQDAVAFGVKTVVGSYAPITRADGADCYEVTERMTSENTILEGGAVPTPPTGVKASPTTIPGTVRVTWDWSWAGATAAELSWSDHEDAWESTDAPDTYEISTLRAGTWNISGLETGVTWYIRVRLKSGDGDSATYGPYSSIESIDLSSAPSIPTLFLSDSVITEDGSVTASWAYVTTDGTAQAFAEICEATIGSCGITYSEPIARTQTAQHITIRPSDPDVNWTAGTVHSLCVRVTSASGKVSDAWSDPVSVTVAEPLEVTIAQTSLVEQTIIDDVEEGISHTALTLTETPLTVTALGAGAEGTTTITIERDGSYHIDRPDENPFDGNDGEVIALMHVTGEQQVSIANEQLLGPLDDGARYRLTATISDELGQTATSEPIVFEVKWTHQALIPRARAAMDQERFATFITPIAPEGCLESDCCDIYRLSADKPELIFTGAQFGQTYVDPYPTIGDMGGHRVVFRTANGDYITEDNTLAWVDLGAVDGDLLDINYSLIDFNGLQIPIRYNMSIDNSWGKDFEETQYLGGSTAGDWNPAVSRTGSVSAVCETSDIVTQQALRRLAVYPGSCHVRTVDGSSYKADVQVKNSYSSDTAGKIVSFSLSITRVDPEELDGTTLTQWEA